MIKNIVVTLYNHDWPRMFESNHLHPNDIWAFSVICKSVNLTHHEVFTMQYAILYLLFCFSFHASAGAIEQQQTVVDKSDDIYWESPEYKSRLSSKGTAEKVQYVYHKMLKNFVGHLIIPLNMMPELEGYSLIYNEQIAKYTGREHLLSRIIPTLNCLWNDVIFLSPVHPHKHYEEYVRLGFTPKSLKIIKIPVEVLKEKRLTVWKWFSYKKYPRDDPIHESIQSYCPFDFSLYQEMNDLPEDTKEFYADNFDPEHPDVFPRYNWYRIPHILCQDPIDLLDDRITIIDWADPIDSDE